MALEILTIKDDEIAQFRETLLHTFGSDADADPGGDEQHRATVALGQSWAAFDGTTIVATAATFNLDISLPGGNALPMAGLTMVTVRPSHRRRGLLRQLMERHLDDARQRSLPVSGLWASEATIYGRFGYGLAAFCEAYSIDNAHALRIADRDFDELQWLDEPKARELLPAIYARAIAERPGALRRSDVWWRERRFAETPWSRGGASKRRHVVARRGSELVGYLAFRQRGKFGDGMPAGSVEIVELLAIDPRAEATLWRFALSVDLFPTVTWWNAPADDSLPWLVDDFRRIKRRRGDNLWLRIEDVPATLERRTYSRDGMLRIGIGATTYELASQGGRAWCSVTQHAPDLELDMPTLGTLFLGCVSATQLARAERIRGTRVALLLADQMFATELAPWCPEVF
ncbi:MAG TPA: GNAT family N-acetyltransferase [Kofleriaceae bacterium]